MTRFLILCAIYYQAIVHGFDPRLIVAQVFCESSFRPAVVNNGCYGLMQISLATWKSKLQLDPKRLTEINYNLCKGLCVLRYYYDLRHGDIDKALNLYGNGYKYHSNYVQKVREAYRKIYGR
jgi:soluble lytic murein transglycosylase-like protein